MTMDSPNLPQPNFIQLKKVSRDKIHLHYHTHIKFVGKIFVLLVCKKIRGVLNFVAMAAWYVQSLLSMLDINFRGV